MRASNQTHWNHREFRACSSRFSPSPFPPRVSGSHLPSRAHREGRNAAPRVCVQPPSCCSSQSSTCPTRPTGRCSRTSPGRRHLRNVQNRHSRKLRGSWFSSAREGEPAAENTSRADNCEDCPSSQLPNLQPSSRPIRLPIFVNGKHEPQEQHCRPSLAKGHL